MFFQRLLFYCLILACLTAAPVVCSAQPSPSGSGRQKVTLDFKDIELTDLIQTVSELTGKNFLFDDSIKGKVTIVSPAPMAVDEAYEVFLTVLNVKGYTVVPSGKTNKIVQTKTAKESNLPTVTGGAAIAASEDFVTRLVPLTNVDATEIATTVLAPLIPKTSNIVAYPPSNTLIITDSGANIERLLDIVRELDIPSSLDLLEVLALEYASAEEVAKICIEVLNQSAAGPQKARKARNVASAGGKEQSKIIPYGRTNSLVVMATADDMATVRGLLAQLDQKPAQERSHINVFYLENADAETLGKTLNEILTGVKAKAQTAAKGQPGQAAPLTKEQVSITADKPTNSLIINSTPEDFEILKGIIKQLDIKRKQVYVEALVLELSMDATKQLGASLQGAFTTGSESAVVVTTNQSAGGLAGFAPNEDAGDLPNLLTSAVDGILLGGLFNLIDVTTADGETVRIPALSALIDLSKTDSDVNILSAPRLLTSDNEEAEIIVGQNVPIITSRLTDTGGSSGLAQSVSVERKDVALTLRFTPQVTEGNLVRLNVFQEITDVVEQGADVVSEVGPTFTKRSLRNTVLAEDSKTVVLGGLIGSNVQESVTKVPFLGDLPMLGWLFKRKSSTEKKTNLLIFITPKIIRSAGDLAKVTNQAKASMERFRDEMRAPKSSRDFERDLLELNVEEMSLSERDE